VAHVEETRQETAWITKDSTRIWLKKQWHPHRRHNIQEIGQGLNKDHQMPYKMSLRRELSNAKKIRRQIQFYDTKQDIWTVEGKSVLREKPSRSISSIIIFL